jgi:hypothetical protein
MAKAKAPKAPTEIALRLKMKPRTKRPPTKPTGSRKKPYRGQGRP